MHINGPINVWRLEGTINDIHKILYIYSDVHYPIESQTQCNTYDSIDLVTYFNNELFKKKKEIDFFMEVRYKDITNYNKKFDTIRDKYMIDTAQLFFQNFKKHNNIRFHYTDIRDKSDSLYKEIISRLDYKISDEQSYNTINNTLFILKSLLTDLLHLSKGEFNYIISKIKSFNSTSTIFYRYFLKDYLYIFTKLLYKYNNQNIKQLMTVIMHDTEQQIINLQKLTIELHNNINEQYNANKKYKTFDDVYTEQKVNKTDDIIVGVDSEYLASLSYNVDVLQSKIIDKLTNLFSWLVDFYFMRRFLDKNYIVNSILYCGAYHSMRVTQYLIKKLGFKLTHIAYYNTSIVKDKTLITDYIKNSTLDNDNLFKLLFPKKPIQCSDISDFPDNFD